MLASHPKRFSRGQPSNNQETSNSSVKPMIHLNLEQVELPQLPTRVSPHTHNKERLRSKIPSIAVVYDSNKSAYDKRENDQTKNQQASRFKIPTTTTTTSPNMTDSGLQTPNRRNSLKRGRTLVLNINNQQPTTLKKNEKSSSLSIGQSPMNQQQKLSPYAQDLCNERKQHRKTMMEQLEKSPNKQIGYSTTIAVKPIQTETVQQASPNFKSKQGKFNQQVVVPVFDSPRNCRIKATSKRRKEVPPIHNIQRTNRLSPIVTRGEIQIDETEPEHFNERRRTVVLSPASKSTKEEVIKYVQYEQYASQQQGSNSKQSPKRSESPPDLPEIIVEFPDLNTTKRVSSNISPSTQSSSFMYTKQSSLEDKLSTTNTTAADTFLLMSDVVRCFNSFKEINLQKMQQQQQQQRSPPSQQTRYLKYIGIGLNKLKRVLRQKQLRIFFTKLKNSIIRKQFK